MLTSYPLRHQALQVLVVMQQLQNIKFTLNVMKNKITCLHLDALIIL